MKPPVLSTMTIRTLRHHLLARRFAVPKLQRNFVWDSGRAAKLLDSIYHRMPIGSLFLWEMPKASAHLIRQSLGVLPAFSTSLGSIWFVIDGQQRLSVIYQAFEGQVQENDAGRNIDFSRLCFAVPSPGENGTQPGVVYRKPVGGQYVPIKDILAADWKRRIPTKTKSFTKRVADCRKRLLSYPIPVVRVPSATLHEIGDVFIRLNSQGMRVTSADRAIALMGKLDVRLMAQELREKVRQGGFALPGIDPILMGFNLVTEGHSQGDPPKLAAFAQRWSKKIDEDENQKQHFTALWHKYQNAFQRSVDYLHYRFNVYNESYLPSANMLATLSVFFFHHPGQPNTHQKIQIRKWFWTTGIAQRYTGKGYHRHLIEDARLFESLARGKKSPFVFRDLLDPVQDVQAAEYASRSARTRTFFCLLASRAPRYMNNGETIPLSKNMISHANKKHRHHIFPQAQMKNHFPSKVYNSLCNVCFLVSSDNLSIGKRLPRQYLTDYRTNGSSTFRSVMKSHLIPAGPSSGVWQVGLVRAFKAFRQQRLALICKALEKEAGTTLFRK